VIGRDRPDTDEDKCKCAQEFGDKGFLFHAFGLLVWQIILSKFLQFVNQGKTKGIPMRKDALLCFQMDSIVMYRMSSR
jgi:hypothetical protein